MTLTRTLLSGLIGPAAALAVTWYAGLLIARPPAGDPPAARVVEALRTLPDDARLKELAALGVLYPKFDHLPGAEAVGMAERLFAGGYTPEGVDTVIRVPFEPAPWLTGRSSWHLDIQSFWTPALLARAYEVSGETRYIKAAVQYVVDWGRHEASLRVPQGYFFNDHALAARAIVVSELWRLYRGSGGYDPQLAGDFLRYIGRLSRLLLEERLYEYRSNHGVMQCLALMHLGTAFPRLAGFDRLFDTGWQRLERQLGFFMNAEGVILEHSPGYHVDGLKMLGAAWRLLGMNGRAVPPQWSARYHKALEFAAALRRPDDTLPPVGDTHDSGHFPLSAAVFDAEGVVRQPLRPLAAEALAPAPLTLAPAAGYAVTWHANAQTLFHWGHFATGIHKHADELGLSIWAAGRQWIRPIGYWPYMPSRRAAIGWRSSNAPHWLDESAAAERSSALQAYASSGALSLFDVIRTGGGRSIRRQVARAGAGTWVVVDSFQSTPAARAEILWRFPPGLQLKALGPEHLALLAGDARMTVLLPGAAGLTEADTAGTAAWNTGLIEHGKITPSPALRIETDGRPVVTVFILDAGNGPAHTASLHWEDPAHWSVELGAGQTPVVLARQGDRVMTRSAPGGAGLTLIPGATPESRRAGEEALAAYHAAFERYGHPFEVRLERRLKVTAMVLALAVCQLALFVVLARRARRWWWPAFMVSSLAWFGLCLFLHLRFLAMD